LENTAPGMAFTTLFSFQPTKDKKAGLFVPGKPLQPSVMLHSS
jgi:hypothetical protein